MIRAVIHLTTGKILRVSDDYSELRVLIKNGNHYLEVSVYMDSTKKIIMVNNISYIDEVM